MGGASPSFSPLLSLPTGLSINSPLIVTGVSAGQSGQVLSGQTLHISLTLSGPAVLTQNAGGPSLMLSNGAAASYDPALSVLSAGKLVFDYTVGQSVESQALSVVNVNLPNGVTVRDAAGDNADFAAAVGSPLNVQLGLDFVSLSFIVPVGAVSTGQSVQAVIQLAQGVTITGGMPTLSLNDGGVASYDPSNSNPGAGLLVFDYAPAGIDHAIDLSATGINLNGASIVNGNGVGVDFSAALNVPSGLTVNSPLKALSVSASQTGVVQAGATYS